MARYTEAVCRLCRRENQKLFLKGDRCYSAKCPVVKRGTAPGQHAKGRRKVSEYGLQLREKQKARRTYGILEKQFHGYFVKASNMKGASGENMLQLLERRLDNVVYRLGFGDSRAQARQIVNHGHITVNGRRVKTIPAWLELNSAELSGKVVELPKREDIDLGIEEHLIVELYSK